jgi:hypothetical protein
MLSAAITYQALLQENQQAIDKVKALLEDTSLLHVRARQHIWRNRAVDLLRGFQVDDPLDLQRRAGIPVLNSDQECYQKEELDASLCCHTGVVSFSLAV